MIDIDLGDGHTLSWVGWHPDDLPANRERFGVPLPSLERMGASIAHKKPDGSDCWGHIYFNLPEVRAHFPASNIWQVESWEPLTISPSVLCMLCGDHGFIRGGRWVRA